MRNLILIGFFLLHYPTSEAVMNTSRSGSSIDASKIPAAGPDCDQTCNSIISNGKPSGLSSASWSSADDQWCADHGAQTEAGIMPGPTPTSTPSTGTTPNCNVNLSTSDVQTFGRNACVEINKRLRHCQLHNSQVELQCMAYKSAYDARDGNILSISFDAAAVAACTAACFGGADTGLGAGLGHMCGAAGMAAGAAEMASIIKLETNETAKALRSVAAGIGIASGAVGAIRGGQSAGAAEDGIGSKFKDKGACISMAIFGVMTGLRVWDIMKMEQTRSSSCDSVKKLLGDSAISVGGEASSTAGGNRGSGGSSGSGGGSGGRGTGGNTGAGDVGAYTDVASSVTGPCPGDPSKICSSRALGATDGDALTQTGLDRAIAPIAQNLENGIRNKLNSGASAGEIISGALNGAGGSFGDAIAHLADMAQKNPQEVFQMFPNASSMMSSGGSGGGGGGTKQGDPFASLFGGGSGGGGLNQAPSVSTFGAPPRPIDIWHSDSKQNLFEIVSSKIEVVSNRVQTQR